MPPGVQDGKDVHIIFTDNKFEYSWYFEAKNYNATVGPNEVLGKLVQIKSQNPDEWIIVSPKTPVGSNVQGKLEEEKNRCITKISKWTPTEKVAELFSLYPDVFKAIYGTDPDDALINQRDEILARWKHNIDIDCMEINRRKGRDANPIPLIANVSDFSKIEASYKIEKNNHFILNLINIYDYPIQITLDSIWFTIPKKGTIQPEYLFICNNVKFCDDLLNAHLIEYFFTIEQDREHFLDSQTAIDEIDLGEIQSPWPLFEEKIMLTYHYSDNYVEEVEIKSYISKD